MAELTDLGLVWTKINGEYVAKVESGGKTVVLKISNGVLTANGKTVPGVHPVVQDIPQSDGGERKEPSLRVAAMTPKQIQHRLVEVGKKKAQALRDLRALESASFVSSVDVRNKKATLRSLEREEKELRDEPYRRKSQDAEKERERKNEEARNFARGTVADKARMEIGKGWYEGENHVWSYYEWGPGQKPCWYRSDDFDSYNGGTSESYAHAVEICGDPRKRDPKQSER